MFSFIINAIQGQSKCRNRCIFNGLVNQKVAASTHYQALNTILFLYKEVIKQDLNLKIDIVNVKKYKFLLKFITKK